jgi:hypothetical protein
MLYSSVSRITLTISEARQICDLPPDAKQGDGAVQVQVAIRGVKLRYCGEKTDTLQLLSTRVLTCM